MKESYVWEMYRLIATLGLLLKLRASFEANYLYISTYKLLDREYLPKLQTVKHTNQSSRTMSAI